MYAPRGVAEQSARSPGFTRARITSYNVCYTKLLRKARFEAFGCAGQAARIAPLPLEKMAQRYAQPGQTKKKAA